MVTGDRCLVVRTVQCRRGAVEYIPLQCGWTRKLNALDLAVYLLVITFHNLPVGWSGFSVGNY